MTPWVECPTLAWDLERTRLRDRAALPPDALTAALRLLDAVKAEIPAKARILAQLARLRTWGRFQREVLAWARLANVDWRDLMLANLSYDLILASIGCSTMALATAQGPVVARNMDWWPEDLLAQASYLVRYFRGDEQAFVSAGWPGSVGVVTGMSARGFSIVLNAVRHPDKRPFTGYPVLLHLRRVLEDAADFDAALKRLTGQRLTSPALITLVGTDNEQRVVIERTARHHALRWPRGDEPLVATNDFRVLEGGRTPKPAPAQEDEWQLKQTACSRYDALSRLSARCSPREVATDEQLLYLLSDPEVIQDITAQHIIMQPRQQHMRLFAPRRLLASSPQLKPTGLEPTSPGTV